MKHFNLKKQNGLTLIEVLITILIMGFGLLGVAQMQAVSTKSNMDAAQRTTATFLTDDIISRMRSVPLANLGAYYDTGSAPVNSTNPSSAPSEMCTADCTPEEKSKLDLWEWKEALVGSAEKKGSTNTGGLLNPSGCIQVINNQIRVIVAWDSLGKSKSSNTACGTGNSDFKRRALTVFTVL